MNRRVRRLAAFMIVLALVWASATPRADAAPWRKGFVITWFRPAGCVGDVKQECPQGAKGPDFIQMFMSRGLSAAEAERLLQPVNFFDEFADKAVHRGPHGENVCALPMSAPDPGMTLFQGRVSYGLNLDGRVGPDDFVSPTGEPGIDNQYYRVVGCIPGLRGEPGAKAGQNKNDALVPALWNEEMRQGARTYLIELSGEQDMRNDSDVRVGLYVGAYPMAKGAAGGVLANATQMISDDSRWWNVLRGKLVNGVLNTDPGEIRLLGYSPVMKVHDFHAARLRLQLNADGTANGLLGGYLPWESLYRELGNGGSIFEKGVGFQCPGLYYALRRAADAGPDPKTGQNTLISTAYAVEAVPAFVVHPDAHAVSAELVEGAAR
jgi:hypothetical protein